jgi:hypothetical protein
MTLRELIQRATTSKYTRTLEAEVARLRAENRALLNSILGVAGVPPIIVAENDVSPVAGLQTPGRVGTKLNASGTSMSGAAVRSKQMASRVGPRTGVGSATTEKMVPPMRRRSWHQIFRMLEINSARKKEASEIL